MKSALNGIAAPSFEVPFLHKAVLKVPPVVAMDRAQIVKLLGPTMQRYVTGKL